MSRRLCQLLLATFSTSCLWAQSPPSPASLPKSSFAWTQEQRIVGFAHYDEVFPSRAIRRGARIHPLPPGDPLPAFAPGTPGAAELDRYIEDQMVAGILILHDGRVRLERFGLGYGEKGRWVSHSVAKSITSTLVGAAIKDGFIQSLDEPVSRYVKGLEGSAYDSVTIRQLMLMRSGVRWREDYTDPTSDIAKFYVAPVTPGLSATVSYMRSLPRAGPPGSVWAYKTGETHLLGEVVMAATKQSLSSYLSAKIWGPYGMEQDASWRLDRSEHELAGCCLQASLRDFARFGQLVLDGGRIDGHSIVPEGWFEQATTRQSETTFPGRGYGYQWWTFDDGTFSAIGIHGQLIHIDRARRLVVVTSSAWPEATSAERTAARLRMLAMISAAIDDEAKANPGQRPDRTFKPVIAKPSWASEKGPTVCLDEAHHNFHTLDNRFWAFGELLRRDGYVVRPGTVTFTASSLASCGVLVIANAMWSDAEWETYPYPTPSAFTRDEIKAVHNWVKGGGRLLLIADHMPIAGANAALAAPFGVTFNDGFAVEGFSGSEASRDSAFGKPTIFRRTAGTLRNHVIAAGLDSVRTFTGQAFKAPKAEPILVLPTTFVSLMPRVAWQFKPDTKQVPVGGWLQGAVMVVGKGRAAFFGEAAMFSAQVAGPNRRPMGMNAPGAEQNFQLVLNLMHWLVERTERPKT